MVTIEAVIEIGSTSIRLKVCEVDSSGSWKMVDNGELNVSLGWDVFTTGVISKESYYECKNILSIFKEKLESWGVIPQQVKTIAVSALREAKNIDTFFDRILLKTGFSVEIIDEVEEMRLFYLAGMNVLQIEANEKKLKNSIMLDIGGGSTEVVVLQKGKVATVHSLRLGTIIIDQYIKSINGSSEDTKRYLEEFVKKTGSNFSVGMGLENISQLVVMGSDALVIARKIGSSNGKRLWTINRESFFSFVKEIETLSYDEICAKFQLKYIAARSLPVTLMIYKMFLEITQAEIMLVLDTTIRDGVFISKFDTDIQFKKNIESQIIASSIGIGRKYNFNENHAKYVSNLSLKIFELLVDEIADSEESRLNLEVACLLHDIGSFISEQDHEMHTFYLISNSNIFGLSKTNLNIIALISKYHKKSQKIEDDRDYAILSRKERMQIVKLSAILRIANAVDRSQTQHIGELDVFLDEKTLSLVVKSFRDINLEKRAVAATSDLFETVFGYNVVLR